MTEDVTTTHLLMDSPDQLRARLVDDPAVTTAIVSPPNAQLNHGFFMEIGTPFRWFSRLGWTIDDWRQHLASPLVQTVLGLKGGAPFGYCEMEHCESGENAGVTEIQFFGIYAAYIGQGLGGHLLSESVRIAWQFRETRQVYLHTCTNDHPSALANYTARGFRVIRTETRIETIPEPGDTILTSPAYYRSLGDMR